MTEPSLKIPKVDQPALNSGSQSAPTIESVSTSNLNTSHPRPHKPAIGQGQEEDNHDQRSFTSMYSYKTDIDASRFLQRIQGRVFNTLNEAYYMPSDENEWTRLYKKHVAFTLALGGLYPAPETVNALLIPEEGKKKRILDLGKDQIRENNFVADAGNQGSGTSIWAIDMAKKFPHAEVIGVDVAPVPVNPEAVPPNCQFEIDDIELGLTHFRNKFDLIHARMVTMGLKDFRKSMTDVHNCLKPGGLIIWMEPDLDLFTPDIHVYREMASEANPTGTWMGRFHFEVVRIGTMIGGSDFAQMAKILDDGFWNESLFDPGTCRTASLYIPIGPWANHEDTSLSQRLKYIGALTRQDLREATRAMQVGLTKAGWAADTVSEWQSLAEEEILNMMPPIQARHRLVWGRRRAAPGQPAPPLPLASSVSSTTEEDELSFLSQPYPFLYIYDTQEQAMAEKALRQRSKEGFSPPPPMPSPSFT